MTKAEFIQKKADLFWYIQDKDKISLDVLVETILNYGNFSDVKELLYILGIQDVRKIFENQIKKKRNNYPLPIKNYFSLYFQKYA